MRVIDYVLGMLSGSAIWILLGAGLAYSIWTDRRLDRWQRLGLCTRCGRQPAISTPTGTSLMMRGRCTGLTNRNHRLGLYFFLGMAILGGLSVIIGTVSDVSRGYPLSGAHLLLGIGAVGVPLLVALGIRRAIT